MNRATASPPARMLDGCKVLDLTGHLGWLAGSMLADLGADVIKVEPPDKELTDPEWRAANFNKRLLRIDPASRAGRDALERMFAAADILIETARPGDPDGAWLAPERVSAFNAGLIHVSITPFGHRGPRAGWRGSDLEIMAAGGAMALAGEPDGAPLRISVPQACSWAGVHGAAGALTALLQRNAGGSGQHVDVSAQASVVVALAHAPTFFDILGEIPNRAGSHITGRTVSGAVYRAFWPCKDGYINFVIYGGPAGRRTNRALVAWMREKGVQLGALEGLDWDEFDPKLATQDDVDRIEAPLAEFFRTITKFEFLQGACAREMLGYPVATVADIAADPQLEARGFWQDIEMPEGECERHCGSFYVVDGSRPEARNPMANADAGPAGILRDYGFSAEEIAAVRSEFEEAAA